ncbi:hypothetical protein DMB92_08240 [Campylobacter sp. MIT 99-7217]|uniref:hypothetical protein n=1 Tax=Campylobacter sp. MIT 99-7217 TaxID=535091 RepID=UPI0011588945|nr:hypothetical protein [Campylobacter sp. MIT 99-7217]TQR29341.1 hypothetical protein DMB92_08240 [Campylobacter sp. MIT 99-7217]
MSERILSNDSFVKLMIKHCHEVIASLVAQNVEFGIVVNTHFVSFEPKLPENLNTKEPYALYILAGYTFESINLEKEKITFHAGFGPDDFATFVSVDLGAINQIQVGREVIFVNFALYKRKQEKQDLIEKSKNMFLNSLKDEYKK